MKRLFILILVCFFSLFIGKSQPWSGAESLHKKFMLEARYDSALYYAEESAAIMRGTIGEKNIQYCNMLGNLAYSHYYLGNYRKAKYFIIREAGLWESLRKADGPGYVNCLQAATIICRKAGQYEEALTYIRKADKKAQDLYNTDSREYAEILYNYAGVYHDYGCAKNDMIYLNQEDKFLKRAEAIYSKYGDKAKYESVTNKSDQASWNNNVGNLPAAEKRLLEVAEFYKNEFGAEYPGYATALNNLAVLYYNSGSYKLAENNLIEAIGILKKSADPDQVETAICLNNLGAMYYEIGNFEIASKTINSAKEIAEKAHQQDNPLYAVMLNNLASVALNEEYYASADKKSKERLSNAGKLIFKADSIFMLNCQKPHPYNLSILFNIGIWYSFTGDKKMSQQTFASMGEDANLSLRVVAITDKMGMSGKLPLSLNSDPAPEPVIIPISNGLYTEVSASDSKSGGSLDGAALALLRMVLGKATNIKKAVGIYHPAYREMLKLLIIAYANSDDFKSEEELTLESVNVLNRRMLQDFSYLSEAEKEMYYKTRLPDADAFSSYSLTRKRTNPLITRYAYDNILLNKGLMLKSSTAMRLAILNSNNPVLLKQYDEWIALQKEISKLYSTPVEMRDKDVAELENKANSLERSLVASSQDFSDYRKGLQITWDDIRKNLKPDEAAIEFTDFKRLEKDGGDGVTYCALVLKANSEYPEMIKLFTEDQLTAIITKSGANNINDINDIYGTAGRQDEKLYNLIWKPLEAYLTGVVKVFISPSGLLNKISFPAISNGRDVYLCDKYQVQVKGSTGNIAVQTLFSQGNIPSALILGGILYSEASSGSDVWGYLKGTKDEGDVISNIFEKARINVRYLSGKTATETYIKENAGKYNILHLATHGFFFADPNEVRFEEKNQKIEYGAIAFRGAAGGYAVNSFVNSENPLMRSGLVLAGANDVWVKTEKGVTDDGVLTAQEVTQMDMRKNDLVVLSACETGLGDIKGSEGVYGLQRALKMAGVKYIIMSLWEIPDKETVEFMGEFYNNLLKVKDIREAFYGAQKMMRAKYDPYYWGAFVLME
jgi:CHAT domain-containing protein